MTEYLMLLILMLIVFWDLRLLRQKNADVVDEIFQIPLWLSALTSVSFLAIMTSNPKAMSIFPIVLMMVYFPFYLWRRWSCLNILEPEEHRNAEPEVAASAKDLLSDFFLVIFIFTIGYVVINIIVGSIVDSLPQGHSKLYEVLTGLALAYGLILTLIAWASRKFPDRGFWVNVGFNPEAQSKLQTVFIPIIVGLTLAWISVVLVMNRVDTPDTPMKDIVAGANSPGLLALFMLFALGLAPLIEEIVFRGYFFHVLSANFSKWKAIFVVAFLFAVFHVGQYWGDWAGIAMVGVIGLTLTLLRSITKTTLASTITHYVYNAGVTILPIIMIMLANPSYVKYKIEGPRLDNTHREILLKESLKKDPKLADAYNDLAYVYAEENKNLDEALVLINKGLAIQGDEDDAFLDTKAHVLFKLGRFDEARSISEKILKHTSSDEIRKLQEDRLEKIRQLDLEINTAPARRSRK